MQTNENHMFYRSDDVTGYVAGEAVLMGVVPWIHIFGQTVVALAGLKAGASVVSMPKFLPELFLKLIKDYKVTHARHVRKVTGKHANDAIIDYQSSK